MGILTFIPTLLLIVRRICIYTARHDAKIRNHLAEHQLPAYNALRAACDAFLAIVPPDEPLP